MPLRLRALAAPACLLLAWSLGGCASSRDAVPLLLSSNAPAKASGTQLREGMLQLVRDWADAKARIEEVHARRVAEMLALEADIAFLEEAARIDPRLADDGRTLEPGRLERLLGVKTQGERTLEEDIREALEPPARAREPVEYFRTYLAAVEDGANAEEQVRFVRLWAALGALAGEPIADSRAMAAWLGRQGLTTWVALAARWERREHEVVVADGGRLLAEIRAAARDLRVEPPGIAEAGARAERVITRLRHRRAQFPVVDRLLSHLLVIARDLDTYLQNDVEAIHWREVGAAIGKAQTIRTDMRRLGEDR